MSKTFKIILLCFILLALAFSLSLLFKEKVRPSEGEWKEKGSALSEIRGHREACRGSGTVNLTYSPMPLEQVELIQPMGLMQGQHVTPTDHQYFIPPQVKDRSELTLDDLSDVIAPGDGVITSVERMNDFFAVKNAQFKDYRLYLHYTCDLYTIFIHIYQLSPEIEEQVKDLGPGDNKYVSIPVVAGQRIGKANGLDFSLVDENVVLPGFIFPAHYDREPWKVHTVDAYPYFVEPLRTQLIAKSLRKVAPYGGKIDHDIDGRLIGTWFKEGTRGYRGIKEPEYWVTHVSFSPNAIDPSYFLISFGNFSDDTRQFGTKDNSPDPAQVSVSSGPVKYELVDYIYVTGGSNWNGASYADGIQAASGSQEKGIVLVQLVEDRKLRLEIFPDRKAEEVSGFTEHAVFYER
ncbi:MAG: hypothetical protein V1735_07660 [Nanoarchaeota archaeon]